MASKPPLPREEVLRILARLSPLSEDGRIVLIGGQAVAWWTYFLKVAHGSEEVEIFTSEDIDFEGAARSAQIAAELIEGEVRLPKLGDMTPNTAKVLFRDSEGIKRELDFLGSPLGLDATDVRSSAVPMKIPDDAGGESVILVMHPERCMESRVHNVVTLGTTGRIAMTQLTRSIECARAWSHHLLGEDSVSKTKRTRAVLNLNERIFSRCIHSHAFRRLAVKYEIEPFEAVLVDDRLPAKFRERRYPQMVEQIEGARERARVHWDRYSRQK